MKICVVLVIVISGRAPIPFVKMVKSNDLSGKQHKFDFNDDESEIFYDFVLNGIRNNKSFLKFNLIES